MSALYYSRYQNVRAEMVSITASGSTITMPLWPLTQFFPQGSLGDMASEAVQLRSQITEQNTRAKVEGLYGTTGAFAVTNGQTVTRTIALGPPATQPRGSDLVGYFTMCAQGTNSAAAQKPPPAQPASQPSTPTPTTRPAIVNAGKPCEPHSGPPSSMSGHTDTRSYTHHETRQAT